MSDEPIVDVEDRRENGTAAVNDGHEGARPPDIKRFQREIEELSERIRDDEAKLKFLEKQTMSSSAGNFKAVPRDKLLGEQCELRAQREKVIRERKQFDVELKSLNMQVQKKNDECTKLQASLRYKSEARIDDAVRRLEHQVQAQQLKIVEEKRLVSEIDRLKRSKRNLNDYLELKQYVEQLRNKQSRLRGQRDDCVKRVNRLKAREEEVKNLLESGDTNTVEESQSHHAEQLKQKEDLKKGLTELRTKRKVLTENLEKEKNEYHAAVKEMKAQKQREELARRKNEKLVILKEMESNRGKKKPYEKEYALCITLIGHFEKMLDTFPHLPDAVASSGAEKEPSLSPRTDAEFSGSDSEGTFLRRKSATDDLVGVFAGSGRIQRRGSRKGKRSSTKEAPRKLNLQLEVVENLLALHLSPPSSVADLPKVLEELQAKKNFCENASTSHDVLPASNNDPMTPITEEVAPEFPRLLVTSHDSENSKDVIPSESALAATNDQVQACLLAESRGDCSNSFVPVMKGETSDLYSSKLQKGCAKDNSSFGTESAVIDTCSRKKNLAESACQKLINSANELLSKEDNTYSSDYSSQVAVHNILSNSAKKDEDIGVGAIDIMEKDGRPVEEGRTPEPPNKDTPALQEAVSISTEHGKGGAEGDVRNNEINQEDKMLFNECNATGGESPNSISLAEAMSNSAESKNHKTCPEDEVGHSKIKPIDKRLIEVCKTCSATQGGFGLEGSRREDKGRDKEEFRNSDIVQDDVLWNSAGAVDQDLETLEGATSNSAKNDKGSLVENVREIDFYPKGEICITKQCNAVPEVQSPSSCRASSPHSSNKLVDGNNLDGTFERNSLNEGGTIVKLHCEKCPA